MIDKDLQIKKLQAQLNIERVKCSICVEGNVEFYLRYKTICKKCHYKKQKAYNKRYKKGSGYGWY